jgi:hypothetical protein
MALTSAALLGLVALLLGLVIAVDALILMGRARGAVGPVVFRNTALLVGRRVSYAQPQREAWSRLAYSLFFFQGAYQELGPATPARWPVLAVGIAGLMAGFILRQKPVPAA